MMAVPILGAAWTVTDTCITSPEWPVNWLGVIVSSPAGLVQQSPSVAATPQVVLGDTPLSTTLTVCVWPGEMCHPFGAKPATVLPSEPTACTLRSCSPCGSTSKYGR